MDDGDTLGGPSQPFAFGEEWPTAFFAGIRARQWTSVREIKTGEEMIDLYAFLTTDPNAEIGAVRRLCRSF